MKFWNQLYLLLWKNFVIHRRQKVRVCIEILWPLILFFILMWVRTRGLRLFIHECHFDAKAMPSAGLLPFAQSTVCTLNNTCHREEATQRASEQQYNASLLIQLVSDVNHIVNEHLTNEDTVNSIKRLSRDLEALSAFVKKLTNTEFPLSGVVALEDVMKNDEKTRYSFEALNISNKDFYPAFFKSSISVRALQKIFDRGKDDLQAYFCKPGAPLLLFVAGESEEGGKQRQLQRDLCKLSASDGRALTLQVFRSLNWTAIVHQVSSITRESGHDLSISDWVTAFQLAQDARNEVWALSSFQELLAGLADRVSQVSGLLVTRSRSSSGGREEAGSRLMRLVQVSVCGRNVSSLLDAEQGPAQRFEEFREQVNRNLQEQRDEPLVSEYIYDNSTSPRCNAVFKSFEHNQLMRFLWRQVKPYVRGKILFAPDTPATRRIIQKVNETFEPLNRLKTLAQRWTVDVAPKLTSWLSNNSARLQQVRKLSMSGGLEAFLVAGEGSGLDLGDVPDASRIQSTLTWLLSDWDGHLDRVNRVAEGVYHVFECFEMNRFEGFSEEEALMPRGLTLMRENKLWAALVFTGLDSAPDTQELPPFIRYKIRMDARKVDSTKRVEDRIFRPGPRRRPTIDLKYLTFGFAYLQDLVEHSIISLQTGWKSGTGVYLQQFPYPCYIFDQFIVTIAESFPMFMVLSWVYSFAMLIKSIVREKELRLKEVMRAMGLGSGVLWLSWFIDAFGFMLLSSLLLTCILKFGQVLDHSDPVVIFVFLACFGASIVCKAFLVAALFSRANIAAAAGGILFFTCYLPYPFVKLWKDRLSIHHKSAVSLVPNVAFGLGCSYFAHFEEQGVGVHWHNLLQGGLPPDSFSIAHVMALLLLDALLYFALAWYLEAVCPGQYGVPKPWYFFVTKSYWCGTPRQPSLSRKSAWESCNGAASMNGRCEDMEEEPHDLPLGVLIRKLTKVYAGADRAAVNELSLNFYEGQITSFLGHNGAGKTTTISILTGLYPPTQGTAEIYGRDIRTEMDIIRRSLGTCPQYNVLFDNLTVAEHLWFYARLKGISKLTVDAEVESFVHDLALVHKRDEYSCNLSGGMQRKLSVAIAFVGGSQTVILDEPTAGVDPYARRAIWDLMLKYKQGRTVIMTTHHMDEADLLGDRIAVINEGRLRCCGSSLFLKTRFGSGYYLTLVRPPAGRRSLKSRSSPTASAHKDASPSAAAESDTPSNAAPSVVSPTPGDAHNEATSALDKLIRRHIPRAELATDMGADLSYRLPASPETYASFVALCKELDANLTQLGITSYGISDTTLEEVFLRVTQGGSFSRNQAGGEGNASGLVLESVDEPPKTKLQKMLDAFRIWCMSLKTSAKTVTPDTEDADLHPDSDLPAPPLVKKVAVGPLLHRRQLGAMYRRRFMRNTRNYKGLFCEIILPALFVLLALVFTLLIPPLSEEPPLELTPWVYGPPNYVFYSTENTSSGLGSRYTDTLLSPPGLGPRCVTGEPLRGLKCAASGPNGTSVPVAGAPYGFESSSQAGGSCSCASGSQQCTRDAGGPTPPAVRSVTTDILLNVTGRNLSDWLLKTWNPYHNRRFGGVQFGVRNHLPSLNVSALEDAVSRISVPGAMNLSAVVRTLRRGMDSPRVQDNVKVWFNNKGWVSSVAYMNAINNVLLRAHLPPEADPSLYGISVVNHPMNFTQAQLQDELLKRGGLSLLHATCVIFAMSFVPASFVMFLIEDRTSGSQHLQFVSGLKPFLYWIGNYTWDLCNYVVPALLCVFIFMAFKEDAYVSHDNIGGLVLLLMLYGWSSIPLMYPSSFIFSVPSSAFVTLACCNLFVGIVSTVSTYVLELFDDKELQSIARILRKVFLVLPQYCLGRGLMDMFSNHLTAEALARFGLKTFKHPLEWDFLGLNLVSLAIQGLVYFIFTLLLQYRFFVRKRQQSVPFDLKELSDDDVVQERDRVLAGQADDFILKVENLTKVYRAGQHPAVNHLCVGVRPGECFGLLGVNGAGKTTTFKMLTGNTQVTEGNAYISGYSIRTQLDLARQNIGYCPQFDALDPLLTGWEHLEFYARLRGIPDKYVQKVADWGIRKLGLQRYAHRCAGTYSGGNKRKLNTAIALVSDPPLVFLDEPTTGMDPKARRFLWDCILDIVRDGRSVILTSHSMEECEALCSRLAIMVNGQFRCLGSIQHLKNKYGAGYTVTLKVRGASAELVQVASVMERSFGAADAQLREQHLNQMEYQLSPSVPLATLFERLEAARESSPLEDYSVTQTTLDQVFINFAKQQGDVAGELGEADSSDLPSTLPSSPRAPQPPAAPEKLTPVVSMRPASSGPLSRGQELIELPEWIRETDIV
ncbi:phospholipid-transporting ATPase ABCA1-like isoform X2 [Haemaphysalis longicornis]